VLLALDIGPGEAALSLGTSERSTPDRGTNRRPNRDHGRFCKC